MTTEEFNKYVSLIQSMALDYQMGGITQGTFTSNLRMICAKLTPPQPIQPEGPSCAPTGTKKEQP